MADFFQTGSVATLHRLGEPDLARLERNLIAYSTERPIALVLPCHYDEIDTIALKGILRNLCEVPYLKQIVIGIDGADAAGWHKVRKTFAELSIPASLLWNDGPRIQKLIAQLQAYDLISGESGKGRNLWLCFGFLLGCDLARVVAVHDCDILTYNRTFLARLCYPIANSTLGFDFCKGYSARFTDRLYGRVNRLLFTPLVRALHAILGPHPLLNYLDGFRYALSGDVCFNLNILRRMRMPTDWGVEIGMLAEMFRVVSPKAICQVDVAERYDHKHQALTANPSGKGLEKMATDIAKSVFHTLALQGIILNRGIFDTLLSVYLRTTEDAIRFYAADADLNGLIYDRHEEERIAATFVNSIRFAMENYLTNPLGNSMLPNWNRVESTWPEFFSELRKAVEQDNY